LTRDVFPGYGEDGSDSREYANGSKWFAAEMTGRAGAEGNGKADIETAGNVFCTVDKWGIEIPGWEGDYPVSEQCFEIPPTVEECTWEAALLEGGHQFRWSIFEDTLDPTLASLNLLISTPLGFPLANANYDADISDYSGGDLLFVLQAASFPEAPEEITVHPGGCEVPAEITGNAGAEGNGKAAIGVNEMSGNAGYEINGKADVETT